ncbi:C6 transcription factor, putative [Cordyceps militaris CM01]|uniref:C6 transcription factor, putative n=1 Tax=Cordyceps militaris (strain CM01) TaxID=983644 RepID=G3JF95_CORMM|nr:C6 transcription factor, putative [Cordyceps militaris CM01]EGX93535.1 C6 transcription factor, putative [Cordyceps militaris CM01]
MSDNEPRPSWPTLRPAASRPNSLALETEPPQKGWPLVNKLPRKSVAVAACESCRQRKVKCNAQRPSCAACQKRNLRCRYDAAPSETPGQALKRKYTQLQDRSSSSAAHKVFNILQMRSEEEALQIFHRIRCGADPESILRLVQNADVMMDLSVAPETRLRYEFPWITSMPQYLCAATNVYLQSPIYNFALDDEGNQQLRTPSPSSDDQDQQHSLFLRPYHAATIIDPRLNQIKPSEWTRVSQDDGLMRKMLQHFFMYEYQWHTSFQKDYFLDDMVSGKREFCSPLLVNSILAHACHSSNRTEYWETDTLAKQFISEAKRLWAEETGINRLTTVQAGPLLYLAYAICLEDKIGKSYLIQSVAMAQDLGIFKLNGSRVGGRAQDARDFTAWAIYCTQIHNQWYFQDAPLMDRRPEVHLPDPTDNQYWYGEIWLKYPSSDRLHACQFGDSFRARTNLSFILEDILWKHFSNPDEKPMFSIRQIASYHRKLEQWYNDLPEPLTPSRALFPVHLKLHMHYYNTVIRLMTAAVNLGERSICADLDGWTAKSTSQELLSEAAILLETVVRLYYLRHSFERLDTFLVQPLMELSNLRQADAATNHVLDKESVWSTVVLCAQGFRDQGHSHYLGQILFQMTRNSVAPEIQTVIDKYLYPGPQADAPLLPSDAQSDWPATIISVQDDAKHHRLSVVLQRLEGAAAANATS